MTNLNFKHLRYFWMVAKSGGIARASEQLHLTPRSISAHLSELEDSLGVQLLRRVGQGGCRRLIAPRALISLAVQCHC